MFESEFVVFDVVVQAVFLMAFVASAWAAAQLGIETRRGAGGMRDRS